MIYNTLKYKLVSVLLFVLVFFSCNVFAQKLSFDDAMKKAKKENKKVIIDVYTDWCG